MKIQKLLIILVAVTLLGFFGVFSPAYSADTADVIFVVDESGSMGGEHDWIGGMVTSLDTELNNAGISGNQYGLVGFGGSTLGSHFDPHSHDTSGIGSPGTWLNAGGLSSASTTLVTSGGTEDGYLGIDWAINNYSFRSGAATNFVLITDEDRDVANNNNLVKQDVLDALNNKNAQLNSVVNISFTDGDGNSALGIDSNSTAYIEDGSGGFTSALGATIGSGFGTTEADYVDLALDTEGAAWDLNKLRSNNATIANSFTEAFVDIKVGEIQDQPGNGAPVPEPTTWMLLGTGLVAMLGLGRKKLLKK